MSLNRRLNINISSQESAYDLILHQYQPVILTGCSLSDEMKSGVKVYVRTLDNEEHEICASLLTHNFSLNPKI